MNEKMNFSFDIPLREMEDYIGTKLNGENRGYSHVIPLREIGKVHDISLLKDVCVQAALRLN